MGVHGKKRRSGEDPGKIHRSVGVQCSGVSGEKGRSKWECPEESDEGDRGVRGKET